MKIIILGAGQVGSNLTEQLCQDNDVTVIDLDAELLHNLQDRFDIKTVCGHAGYPTVLVQAGIEDADLLIALTSSDEANMIACQVAYNLFGTKTKIARIRAVQYAAYERLFGSDGLAIDVYISPEMLVMKDIERLIHHPEVLEIVNLGNDKVFLIRVCADQEGKMIGHTIFNFHTIHNNIKILAIFRNNKRIQIVPETRLQPKDEIFYLATPGSIEIAIHEFKHIKSHKKNIVIAGGGNIGGKLAGVLEKKYNIKLIEKSIKRANQLAQDLSNTIIIQGNATDRDILFEENIDNADIFCAITDKDEINVMSATLAKRLGARKVMALINQSAFVDILEGGEIDIIISPRETVIGCILAKIVHADVVTVHSLKRGTVEALEIIVHGNDNSSRIVGREISKIPLPKGAILGAIIRKDKVIMANENINIEQNDHVILLIFDKNCIADIEQLFGVN